MRDEAYALPDNAFINSGTQRRFAVSLTYLDTDRSPFLRSNTRQGGQPSCPPPANPATSNYLLLNGLLLNGEPLFIAFRS